MFPSCFRRVANATITGPSRDQYATTLGRQYPHNSLTSASHHLCPSVIVCHSCCKITTIYSNMQIFAAKNRLCLHDYIKTGHFRAPFSCHTPYAGQYPLRPNIIWLPSFIPFFVILWQREFFFRSDIINRFLVADDGVS